MGSKNCRSEMADCRGNLVGATPRQGDTRRNSAAASLTWLLGLTAITCAGPAAAAQEPEGSTELRAKVLASARSAFVQVEVFLKVPADEEEEGPAGAGETLASTLQDRQQDQVARDKKAMDMMGVGLSPREVLVPDAAVSPRRIDRWEVTDSTGRRVQARRVAMLVDAPVLVLEPVDGDVTWPAPQFADAAVNAADVLTLVMPQHVHLEWVLGTSQVRPVTNWQLEGGEQKEAARFWIVGSTNVGTPGAEAMFGGGPRPVSLNLIFNAAGELLGGGVTDRIYAGRTNPPWRAADLRTARRLTQQEWERKQSETRERLSKVLYPARIEYRRPKGGAEALPQSELLAWAVSERVLFIPHALHRTIAAQIDRITVQVSGRDVEARLVGQLNDLDAFMVALPDEADPLPAHSDIQKSGRAEPYQPHVAVSINRKYGANDLRVDYTRVLGATRGYGNRPLPQLVPPPSLGSLVLELDGDPVGVFARRRRPMEELEPYEVSQANPLRLAQQTGSAELFALADWSSALKDPASYFDPHVVRRDEKDEDRRVWLGVEFNPLNRDLAESLGCRKESKDGTVGLMISEVYAGSPAAERGLRPGDVLLQVDVPGRPRPINLAPPRGFQGRPEFGQFPRGRSRFPNPDAQQAPWPSRDNYLTNLLAIVGAGTNVKLSFWRDGKMEQAEFVVANAPPDQDSAEQYKNEELGITVKEVTYEVRTALKMKPDDAGVVVSKVEPGTPAGRARINANEIVQSADGEPLNSAAQFEAIVKKAKEDKKDQIRLVVVNRGQSRFADLKLGL